MQTIASLAERLGAEVNSLVEAMHKLGRADAGPQAALSGDECDILIEFVDDPGVVTRIVSEREKKAEAERKRKEKQIENLQKATEKRKSVAAKKKPAAKKPAAKKPADEEVESAAPAPIEILVEEPGTEHQAEEYLAESVETSTESHDETPANEVEAPAPAPEVDDAPVAQEEPQPSPEKAEDAPVVPEPPKYAAEILPASDEEIPHPRAASSGRALGPLAEAERRAQEEEERRRQRMDRPMPTPDPDVVAEVIRRNNERNRIKQARMSGGPTGGPSGGPGGPGGPSGGPRPAGPPRQAGAARFGTPAVAPPPGAGDEEGGRRGGPAGTSKTAKKKQKKAEKARARVLEETLRRDAAAMVREFTSGGSLLGGPRRKKKRKTREDGVEIDRDEEGGIVEIEDNLTVEQLAEALGIGVSEIILELMNDNIMATKNQVLEIEQVRRIADQHGFEVRTVIPEEEALVAEEPDNPDDLVLRAPVITVMGHVDHGKTSFLDAVRAAKVAAGEAGGITQHIAAYDVELGTGRVVFLDTPGHEAFTAMRARGSQITDVVVLVVAADDGVRPQTKEAIDHAKAAGVPIVVAINKCDKPDATPDRVRQELTQYELLDEQWGGKTIMRNISARTGQGIDDLLEMLALESQMLELRANPKKRARGTIIESELSRGYGAVAWVLVQNGTLRVGDIFLCGETYGRVRLMQSSTGQNLQEVPPATPVLVTGFSAPPEAGDRFVVVEEERVARAVAEKRATLSKQKRGPAAKRMSLEDFHAQMLAGVQRVLNVIVKTDVQGSMDVFATSLAKVGNAEVSVNVVHAGVGGINESDVMLASASRAVVIGFHVTANAKVQKLAEQEGVEIRTYRVIYEALDDVKKALEGMLAPESKETVTGHAEIRQIFRSSALGNIAGCFVTDGEIDRNAQCRILRDNVVIYDGKINTLRRGRDDAKSVSTGFECGIKVERFEDIREQDIIETYKVEAVGRTLA